MNKQDLLAKQAEITQAFDKLRDDTNKLITQTEANEDQLKKYQGAYQALSELIAALPQEAEVVADKKVKVASGK